MKRGLFGRIHTDPSPESRDETSEREIRRTPLHGTPLTGVSLRSEPLGTSVLSANPLTGTPLVGTSLSPATPVSHWLDLPSIGAPSAQGFDDLDLDHAIHVLAALFVPGDDLDRDRFSRLQEHIPRLVQGKGMAGVLRRFTEETREAFELVHIEDENLTSVIGWVATVDKMTERRSASPRSPREVDAIDLTELAEDILRRDDALEGMEQFMLDGVLAYAWIRGLRIQNPERLGLKTWDELRSP